MKACEDCGTRLSNDICPNCHEELYIFETQTEFLPPLSDEFAVQVKEQRADVTRRKESQP